MVGSAFFLLSPALVLFTESCSEISFQNVCDAIADSPCVQSRFPACVTEYILVLVYYSPVPKYEMFYLYPKSNFLKLDQI